MRMFLSILIFSLGTIMLFPMVSLDNDDLLEKAKNINNLVRSTPEEALPEAKKVEALARNEGAHEAEFWAIMAQCDYFKINTDFENLLKTAEHLFERAKTNKYPVYQTVAKIYLFEAYFSSELLDDAVRQLDEARNLIKNSDENDLFVVRTKVSIFMAYTNYYSGQKDYSNQLRFINLAGDELNKLKDSEIKQRLFYYHFLHLANFYIGTGKTDSAKYYAELSLTAGGQNNISDAQFFNYLVLGQIEMDNANYFEALDFFKKAEEIEGAKYHINVETLYNNIIESYEKLGEVDGVKLYQAKRDSLRLEVTENQKKTLFKLLNKRENKNPNRLILPISVIVFLFMSVIVLQVIKKNRILANQEKMSQEYLNKVSQSPKSEDYSKLLNALKNNDPAFMFYFNEVFPDFSSKLSEKNPNLSESDIEFSALLKLKIPTKDIAKYKFIAPKTVLNKKYLLRNKLHVPKGVDIYHWFDDL